MALKPILLLILLITANSTKLRKSPVVDPLQKLQKLGEESSFSQNLVNTVLLHLQTGGQVDDVLTYVREARDTTISDKSNLNSEYQTEMARLDSEIAGFQSDVADMQAELQETQVRISNLRSDISGLETQITNLVAELEALNVREERIQTARNNDVLAFSTRQQRDTQALNALSQIIPRLQELLAQGSDNTELLEVSINKINEQLQKLPKNSAISALVQVSTRFNSQKLQMVIDKLQHIEGAIQAGKDLDEVNEEASRGRYASLMTELESLRNQKSTTLQQARNEKTQKQGELVTAQSKEEHLQTSITNIQALLATTIQTKETSEIHYQRRLTEADSAIQALNDALTILEEGQENLRGRESVSDSLAGQG